MRPEPLHRGAPARHARGASRGRAGRTPRPATTPRAGPTPVSPLAQSWSSPAASTSRSVTPDRRSAATTSSPWRRSATCIASNSASSGRRSQAASAARSAGLTRATRCSRNWRALRAHQDIGDRVDEVARAGGSPGGRPRARRRSRTGSRNGRTCQAWRGVRIRYSSVEPSSGGTGMKLKIASRTLNSDEVVGDEPDRAAAGRRRPRRAPGTTKAPSSAIRKFDAGPARATRTSPLRRSLQVGGVHGRGLGPADDEPGQGDRDDRHQAAHRVEVDDRVERQPPEQLGGRVALHVGDRRVGELVDRERDEQEDRDE